MFNKKVKIDEKLNEFEEAIKSVDVSDFLEGEYSTAAKWNNGIAVRTGINKVETLRKEQLSVDELAEKAKKDMKYLYLWIRCLDNSTTNFYQKFKETYNPYIVENMLPVVYDGIKAEIDELNSKLKYLTILVRMGRQSDGPIILLLENQDLSLQYSIGGYNWISLMSDNFPKVKEIYETYSKEELIELFNKRKPEYEEALKATIKEQLSLPEKRSHIGKTTLPTFIRFYMKKDDKFNRNLSRYSRIVATLDLIEADPDFFENIEQDKKFISEFLNTFAAAGLE